MGNCLGCMEDPSASGAKNTKKTSTSGGGQRLGSAPTTPAATSAATPAVATAGVPSSGSRYQGGSNMLGDGFEDIRRAEGPREAALRAAEERAAKSSGRGISTSNPKAGQLTAKLAEKNRQIDAGLSGGGKGEELLARPSDWN